jgi:hypothetical protein
VGSAEHVVDVGGGTGETQRTLLAAHSHLYGTLFDLLQVVAAVERGERLDLVAGNFFAEPLPAPMPTYSPRSCTAGPTTAPRRFSAAAPRPAAITRASYSSKA